MFIIIIAFSSAIKWEENWIRSILIFHLILFFIGLIWRKNLEVQMGIFSIICLIVFFCERINSLCSENWYEFATQNYFDEHGVFMGVIVCAPLLTIGFLQLLNLLVLASGALIKAKRMKLQRDRNDKKHEEKKRDEIESSTSTRVLRKRRKK